MMRKKASTKLKNYLHFLQVVSCVCLSVFSNFLSAEVHLSDETMVTINPGTITVGFFENSVLEKTPVVVSQGAILFGKDHIYHDDIIEATPKPFVKNKIVSYKKTPAKAEQRYKNTEVKYYYKENPTTSTFVSGQQTNTSILPVQTFQYKILNTTWQYSLIIISFILLIAIAFISVVFFNITSKSFRVRPPPCF
jgi:hypothetical protein